MQRRQFVSLVSGAMALAGAPALMRSAYAHSGGDGAGLGLAITQAIVQTHGGDVAVHPQAAGNAFVMRIPLDRAAAEAPLAPRASRDA